MRWSEIINEADEPVRLKLGSTMRRVNVDGVGSSTYQQPIQLRGFGAKSDPEAADKISSFMQAYEAGTEEGPSANQRKTSNAFITLEPQGRSIYLNHIQSLQKGGGNEALRLLCTLADEHGVTLTLSAKAFGSRAGLTTRQLLGWYERNGFHLDDVDQPLDSDSFEMTRRPS